MSTKTKTQAPHINHYPRCRQPGNRWVDIVPVISTSHFTKHDCDMMWATSYMRDRDQETVILCLDDVDGIPDSEAIRLVTERFAALGYDRIRLDPDGDVIRGLQVHSW